MSKQEFTPGPWKSTPSVPQEGYECFWITACPEPNQEKEIGYVAGPQNERNTVNARLIAAAPALYKALKELAEIVEYVLEEYPVTARGIGLDSFTTQPARTALALVEREGEK